MWPGLFSSGRCPFGPFDLLPPTSGGCPLGPFGPLAGDKWAMPVWPAWPAWPGWPAWPAWPVWPAWPAWPVCPWQVGGARLARLARLEYWISTGLVLDQYFVVHSSTGGRLCSTEKYYNTL